MKSRKNLVKSPKSTGRRYVGDFTKEEPKKELKLTVSEFKELLAEYNGVNGGLLKRLVELNVLEDEDEEFNIPKRTA